MIRINLIGKQGTDPGSDGPNIVEFVIFVLMVLVGLGIVFSVWYANEEKIAFAQHKLKQEQREVQRLQVAIKMVKKYKATKKLLKRQLKVIQDLERAKTGPVRVLDEVSIRIPKQIWINSVVQRGNKLTISGDAESNEWVALFHKKLEDSPYFQSVDLKFTFKVRGAVFGTEKDLERQRFRLECIVSFAS